MARKSTGKRKRFEIFKRDGFKCVYCGATPVQKILRVDHVVPVAEGGTDDPANLVTACFDCNAGKAAIPLDQQKYAAGVDVERQREHVEQIREYLELQKQVTSHKNEAVDLLSNHWGRRIGPISQDMCARLPALLEKWSHEKLVEAIEITARKLGDPSGEYDWHTALKQQKYFSGILRRWKEEAGEVAQPEAPQPSLSARARTVSERLIAERKRLIENGQHTIDNITKAFVLLAYGSGEQHKYATWDAACPDIDIRGLVLRVTKGGNNLLYWKVEDDPNWSLAHEIEAFQTDYAYGLDIALHDGDLETARGKWRECGALLDELKAFVAYLSGAPESETKLRAVRQKLGWPNPPV